MHDDEELLRNRPAMPFHLLLGPENMEDFEEEEDFQMPLQMAVLLLSGAEAEREARIRRRNAHRLYLTRGDLLMHPRGITPWQKLYYNKNDRAYITTMGFDVATFERILKEFELEWNSVPIPREDTDETGAPRLGVRSLDAAGCLGLTLHYLNSTMREITLQQVFALTPTTLNRYLNFSIQILQHVLQKMSAARIHWPTEIEMERYARIICECHPLLVTFAGGSALGAFGSVDGLKLVVATPDNTEWDNATFNGWLHSHVNNNVIVFNPLGEIISARINAPGSWHDSRVAQPIYQKLRDRTPDGYFLVADTAFLRGAEQTQHKIKAPIKSGQTLPSNLDELDATLHLNRQLLSYRQTAEWGMRAIQGSFGRLRMPLNANETDHRQRIIEVCLRLFQVRTRLVGINQIRNVYEPVWKGAEGEDIWNGFEEMIYGEVVRRDRVSRFHIVAVEA